MAEREWDPSVRILLAQARCVQCYGAGLVYGVESSRTCNCVWRAVFRACWGRFQQLGESDPARARMRPDKTWPSTRSGLPISMPSRKREEFMADFCILAKRTLLRREFEMFRAHWLLGMSWRECAPRLGFDRGRFFHAVYRIEQKLGRAFYETEPYGLFPVDEYFQRHDEKTGARAANAVRAAA